MTDARLMIEALTSPVLERLVEAMPVTAEEGLVQWATLHGWDIPVDRTTVARQAALNLLLRALVCYRLDADGLPPTAPARSIIAHSTSLLRNLGVVPQPSSYLDRLAERAKVILHKPQISTLARALQHSHKDVIGEVYTSWVPQSARRALGQFWTPEPIAQLMARWAVQSPDARVLDPAFGSGIFLLTAADRLMQLGTPAKTTPCQVAGVELSPLAFLMGLTNVLLRFAPPDRLRLKWGDFLMPDQESRSAVKESSTTYTLEARQMALPGLEITAPTSFSDQFDAIVCNPPYTRHHHLPEAYKSSWARVMEQEYGIRLSRFSSLFAYFLVQASRMLAPTGRMAFITPMTVFEASYSNQVKAFIQQQLHLRAIVSFAEELPVFEGVDTAACITLTEGPAAPAREHILHIQIRRWPGVEPLLRAIEQREATTTDWGTVREVALSTLEPRRKWTAVIPDDGRFDNGHFLPLSALARVVRGIATGANDFFVLSDDEVAQWDLAPTNLRPVLTKTREAPGYVFSHADFERLGRQGKKRWLLYLTGPVTPGTPEAGYIQYGESRGLHERSLVKTRSLWYAMEQRDPAPIYFTYLSRRRSRFIYNKAGVLALNVFLCIYPVPPISQDETMLKALLAVLNSLLTRDSLRYIGRSYGGDTVKVEPREMDRLPVLSPLEMTAGERKELAGLFDSLCQADSDEVERAIRQAIDEAIAAATGTRGTPLTARAPEVVLDGG